MVLQDEFQKSGYTDLLNRNNTIELEMDLEGLFDLDNKPEELLGIYVSEPKDELFLLLNGDLKEIKSLSELWDGKIQVFTILNGKNRFVQRLKYNIVQLIVSSKNITDTKVEGDLKITRKIIIKGDLKNIENIVIDEKEAVELPFYMISDNSFSLNKEKEDRLKQLLPQNEKLLLFLQEPHKKEPRKIIEEKSVKSFEESNFEMIKEWLEQ